MKPITIWQRFYPDTNTWQHNHISDNHTKLAAPIAISAIQKSAWKNAKWRYHHDYIKAYAKAVEIEFQKWSL